MTSSRTWIARLLGWTGMLVATGVCSGPRVIAANSQQQPALPAAPVQEQTQPAQASPRESASLSLQERADIFMARKSYADAADYYQRALKQAQYSDPVLWNKLGIAYQQQMNYRDARKAYNQALKRNREFSEALNNLGTTYYMQNKYGKSVKYYVRALKINPSSASFQLNLGTAYYHVKKIKEAVEAYRTALSLDPNILNERSAAGTVMQAKGAEPPEYRFYLAKVFASLGRPEEAVRYLRRAFEDGFKDRKKVEEDPDFQKISQNPAYIELMKNPPLPIKD